LTNAEKLTFAAGLSLDDKTIVTRTNSLYYSQQQAQAAGIEGLENQLMSYSETIKSPGVEAERQTVVSQIIYFERDATVPADVPDDLREEQENGNVGDEKDVLEQSRVSVSTFLDVPTRIETTFVAYDGYERVTIVLSSKDKPAAKVSFSAFVKASKPIASSLLNENEVIIYPPA